MPLKSPSLESYLRDRSINISIARMYLEVVQFYNKDTNKEYFGLGLKNQSGDYEVRNPKLKTVVGKKDISFIKGKGEGNNTITVFEGFMDFLSYLTALNKRHLQSDVIILNSTKLTDKAKDFIKENTYQKIYTFFDNDNAGQEADLAFLEFGQKVTPCNHLYKDFKDYNDFHRKSSQNISI